MPCMMISPRRSAFSRTACVRVCAAWSGTEAAKNGLNLPSKPVSAMTIVPSGLPTVSSVASSPPSVVSLLVSSAGVVSEGVVVSSVVLLAQPASRPRQSTSARSSAMSCFMCFIFKPPDFLITRDVFSQLCCEKRERAGPFRRCFSFAYTLGYSTVLYYHKMRLKSTALSFFAKIFCLKKLKSAKRRTFLFIWLHR